MYEVLNPVGVQEIHYIRLNPPVADFKGKTIYVIDNSMTPESVVIMENVARRVRERYPDADVRMWRKGLYRQEEPEMLRAVAQADAVIFGIAS